MRLFQEITCFVLCRRKRLIEIVIMTIFSVSADPLRLSHNCIFILLCVSRLTISDHQITLTLGIMKHVVHHLSSAIVRFRYYDFFSLRNVENLQRFCSRFYGSCLGWL